MTHPGERAPLGRATYDILLDTEPLGDFYQTELASKILLGEVPVGSFDVFGLGHHLRGLAYRLHGAKRVPTPAQSAPVEPVGISPEASSEQHDLDVEVLELREMVDELRKELAGYKRWASSVNEALNTGDGSYRP